MTAPGSSAAGAGGGRGSSCRSTLGWAGVGAGRVSVTGAGDLGGAATGARSTAVGGRTGEAGVTAGAERVLVTGAGDGGRALTGARPGATVGTRAAGAHGRSANTPHVTAPAATATRATPTITAARLREGAGLCAPVQRRLSTSPISGRDSGCLCSASATARSTEPGTSFRRR